MDNAARHPDHVPGAAGEAAAARWLVRPGWRILATGWRAAGGEVDIATEQRGVVAACEVKTRTSIDPTRRPSAPRRVGDSRVRRRHGGRATPATPPTWCART